MKTRFRQPARSRWVVALLVVCLAGCVGTESETEKKPLFDFDALVPVEGVIKVNGKPLEGLVVTFLPTRTAPPAVGETDASGAYSLKTAGRPGASLGPMKVAISYLLSTDGVPQGIGARSSLSAPPAMLTAKEQLPPEFADLGRSSLSADVTKEKKSYNFDITATLPPPPTPKAAKDDTLKTDKAEPAKTETPKPNKPDEASKTEKAAK